MAIQLTDSNFKEFIKKAEKLVVIDFWAEWCAPCKAIAPTIDALAKEYENKAYICKVNVDECNDAAMHFGIRNIPTVLFIKNSEVKDKLVGGAPSNIFKQKIDSLL